MALILIRWFIYKSKRWHYFLFDFCYFVNFLILVYFWSPWKPSWFFPSIFVLSHGPLLFAIALWRNSIVPHSLDKMTSLFIHISPPLTTWGVRWYVFVIVFRNHLYFFQVLNSGARPVSLLKADCPRPRWVQSCRMG